ncbi:hypothetical protein NBRC110019_13020 [Neptunitalea chrysea]|uniref:LTD domain-containing protein n=1 Tax=Neptunitalea chrysea TaxID=1647581 RepID=A0A9W6B433_9FLAO|nr:choice-of-anchor I family protein [Neptunitalea chrysea]GLB52263.1 hypothetical protein NBRC110019_13020 [Neptunitalea chrysea]
MKKILLSILTCLSTVVAFAQLSPGDMSFVGFNADADDDFAIVTFVDIPANTLIFFCDSEWNGSNFGTDENDFYWDSGNAVIPAGTVITFTELTGSNTASSYGTINGSPGGISGSSEAIFAYHATVAQPRVPTGFICAVANSSAGYGDLSNTGLTEGTNALTLTSGTDIAEYNGPRTGLDVSGYQLAINNLINMDMQDDSGDQSNDGTTPDLPFNTTAFVISSTDTTTPQVASVMVTSQTTITVSFSEDVTTATAETIANYAINNSVTVTGVTYDAGTYTATITHSGLTSGTAYTLTVSNVEDAVPNVMTTYTSDDLFYNTTTTGLIITEIMYNAPSDDSDALEFLEIYNNSGSTIALGGIMVKDESNFVFTFPQMDLAADAIVLLATDKATADAFYGVTFLDMPQGISNALGNGGEVLEILNSDSTIIFTVEYSDDSPWPTTADGDGPSLELLNPAGTINDGTNWSPATNLVGQSLGEDVFASPGSFTAVTNVVPQIAFDELTYPINEDGGTAQLTIALSSTASSDVTVNVSFLGGSDSAVPGTDYAFTDQIVTILAGNTTATVDVTITDDTDVEADEAIMFGLSNPVNATLGDDKYAGVYILDNDTSLYYPTTPSLTINYATSYTVDANGSAEISSYDPTTQRLFVMNSTQTKVEILDFSDINNISTISSIDLSSYGTDGATSLAVHNGIVAAAISNGATADGVLVFMDTNGANISTVTVGNLPDNVSFTPDGTKVLTANEGQPNDDYTIDPEGSISVIDVTGGLGNITQSDVTNINFNNFDSMQAALTTSGIRIFGPNASVSEDLEPEYIAYSSDSQTAYVTLQENNAAAVVDLTTNSITYLVPLGYKDYTLPENTMDVSNDTDFIYMGNWNVKGMYMPDAIASYEVNGVTYLITANEGDSREYNGYEEETRIGDSDYMLDPTTFPEAELLKMDTNLGRLKTTLANGDTDGDGDYDEIYVFGGRSFSIWNGDTGTMEFDSGDDFERYTADDPTYGVLFNASNSNNNFKNRSDDKGPEPEGVTTAEINGQIYAFITLERVGGIMTYNVTNPAAPEFVSYKNHRDLGPDEGGDLAPEGIVYIAAQDSPTGTGLIVISNEVSATVSVYTIDNDTYSTDNFTNNNFFMYPNPSNGNEILHFTQEVSGSIYDMTGRMVLSFENSKTVELPNLSTGTYIVKMTNGESKKLAIK